MLTPEILLTIKIQQQLFVDPKRIALLKAIKETSSLSQAAKRIGMSYKTAWSAITEINQLAAIPFIMTTTGGRGGGGTKLSAYAIRFLQLYDLLTTFQQNAFSILNDDNVPLDDLLITTAKLSLQTSARNQLYGTITEIQMDELAGFITVILNDNKTTLDLFITKASVERLKLTQGKSLFLLIKAPLIELNLKHSQSKINQITTTIENIIDNHHWSEIELKLADNLSLFASRKSDEIATLHLKKGQKITISIDPEHIIIATLV